MAYDFEQFAAELEETTKSSSANLAQAAVPTPRTSGG